MSDLTLKILFAGTPRFAAEHLTALIRSEHEVIGVFTQPDRPGKRGRRLEPSPVKTVALQAEIPLHQPDKLDDRAFETVRSLAPDVVVVVAYGQKLDRRMLEFPRHGCINVHASLLPRWRGAAPIQRAILAGDTESGITIMRMDEGWDTGDILLQRGCSIDPTDTAGTLEEKLCVLGQTALLDALNEVIRGRSSARPQEEGSASYAVKISKGEALIDWSRSAQEIERTVRAFLPTPVSFTWLDDLRIRIWQVEVISPDAPASDGTPGEILAAGREGIDIRCGDGILRLLQLQVPSGKGTVLPIADLLNARRDLFAVGRRLRGSRSDSDQDDSA